MGATITYIQGFNEAGAANAFVRYELLVLYTNGDEIRGEFQDKVAAIKFLRALSAT